MFGFIVKRLVSGRWLSHDHLHSHAPGPRNAIFGPAGTTTLVAKEDMSWPQRKAWAAYRNRKYQRCVCDGAVWVVSE